MIDRNGLILFQNTSAHFLCLFIKRVLGSVLYRIMIQFICGGMAFVKKCWDNPPFSFWIQESGGVRSEKNYMGSTKPFLVACIKILQEMWKKKSVCLCTAIPRKCPAQILGYLVNLQMP